MSAFQSGDYCSLETALIFTLLSVRIFSVDSD